MRYVFSFFAFVVLLTNCIPPNKEIPTNIDTSVTNPDFQQIHDLAAKHDVDSLLLYTSDPNPNYRYLLASTLASLQDKNALDSLYKLLNDPVIAIRTKAAFAIGQIKESTSVTPLLTAFKKKDTLDINNSLNAAILEAVSKFGEESLLVPLATVSTYRNTDTLLIDAQTKAIYNYALRGITATEGTDLMLRILTELDDAGKYVYHENARLTAANYLSRAKEVDFSSSEMQVANIFMKDSNPFIRMTLATALSRSKNKEVQEILRSQFESESDYRVQGNILRAYGNMPYIQVVDEIIKHLKSDNVHLASIAADYLIQNGNRSDALIYKNFITDSLDYQVSSKVYAAILKNVPPYYTNSKNKLKESILAAIKNAKTEQEKVAFFKAFGKDVLGYKNMYQLLDADAYTPALRSTAMANLQSILLNDNFINTFRGGTNRVRLEILDTIKTRLPLGDAGELAIAGEILANPNLNYKELLNGDVDFLSAAMAKLNLPSEIESYNSLLKAQRHLLDKEFVPAVSSKKKEINWSVFASYGDSILATIKTEKGNIKVALFPEEAPASVANFIELSNSDFYDNKFFHRVVPSFVVQAGCTRGDGYGSPDYTINSELSDRSYNDEGYLGMASAGLHTEGAQWFITHAPTLHLDGRYTIFGKVVDNMDVVHNLQVGDKILDIVITKMQVVK